MPVNLYACLKALHVACALLFVGGVIADAIVLSASRLMRDGVAPMAAKVLWWGRIVTVPAMLGVWAFGISMSLEGGWFQYGWLEIKLLFVVFVSGIHGVQSGQIRRLSQGVAVSPKGIMPLIVAASFAIAALAVMKPSFF